MARKASTIERDQRNFHETNGSQIEAEVATQPTALPTPPDPEPLPEPVAVQPPPAPTQTTTRRVKEKTTATTVPVGAINREVTTKDRMVVIPSAIPASPGSLLPATGALEKTPFENTIDKIIHGEVEPGDDYSFACFHCRTQAEAHSPVVPLAALREFLKPKGTGTWIIKLLRNGAKVMTQDGRGEVIVGPNDQISPEESDEASSAQKKLRERQEQIKLLKTEAEMKRIQREVDREEKQAKAEAENEDVSQINAVVNPLLEAIKKLNDEVKEIKKQPEPKSIKEQLAEWGPLIAMLAPIFTQMFQRPNDDRMAEALKAMAASQEKAFEKLVTIITSKKDDTETKELRQLVFNMLEKQASNPEKTFQMMMEMQQKGEERAMQMFELTRGGDDEDIDIDPNNPWGSAVAHGIKGIYHLFKHGGPAIAQAFAQMANKPSAAEVTPSDVAMIAHSAKQNPGITPKSIQDVKLPPPKKYSPPPALPESEAPAAQPAASGKIIPFTAKPMEAPADNSPVNAVFDEPVAAPTDDEVALSLNDEINLSVKDMITDVKARRLEFTWVYNASGYWNREFLDKLKAETSAGERMRMVREKADPKLWAELDAALDAHREDNVLMAFITSFDALIEQYDLKLSGSPVAAPETEQA